MRRVTLVRRTALVRRRTAARRGGAARSRRRFQEALYGRGGQEREVGGEDEHGLGGGVPQAGVQCGERTATGWVLKGVDDGAGGRATRADDDGDRHIGAGGEHPVQEGAAADGHGGFVRPAEPPGRASGQHDGVVVGEVVHLLSIAGGNGITPLPELRPMSAPPQRTQRATGGQGSFPTRGGCHGTHRPRRIAVLPAVTAPVATPRAVRRSRPRTAGNRRRCRRRTPGDRR